MTDGRLLVGEEDVVREDHPDRWSKDLIGGAFAPTTAGFSLGVAEYHATEFGPRQVHDDQEAVYVIRGRGQVLVGEQVYDVEPGCAVYVPPGTPHATRRTGDEPVKVVYAHGAV